MTTAAICGAIRGPFHKPSSHGLPQQRSGPASPRTHCMSSLGPKGPSRLDRLGRVHHDLAALSCQDLGLEFRRERKDVDLNVQGATDFCEP